MSRVQEFHVIHRLDGQDFLLGEIEDFRSFRTLDPFISALIRNGIHGGTVLLVDSATGRIVFERLITPVR